MRRCLQSRLALGVFGIGAALLLTQSPGPAGEDAVAELLHVEKMAHKGYTELIKGTEKDACQRINDRVEPDTPLQTRI